MEDRSSTIEVVAGTIETAAVTINVQHLEDTITAILAGDLATTLVIKRATIIIVTIIIHHTHASHLGRITRIIQATAVTLTAQLGLVFIKVI